MLYTWPLPSRSDCLVRIYFIRFCMTVPHLCPCPAGGPWDRGTHRVCGSRASVAGLGPLNSDGERKIAKVGFEPLATVWRSSRQLPSSRGEGIDRLEGALLTLTENMPSRLSSAWSAVKFLRAELLSASSISFLLAWAAPADSTRSKAA